MNKLENEKSLYLQQHANNPVNWYPWSQEAFDLARKNDKPVIAMIHLPALPGSPLYDPKLGLNYIIESAQRDLEALQDADVDAVLFGNENDRPYELKVNTASSATMSYVIGFLKEKIKVPFGVNVLWDPLSTIAVAAATGAQFVREIFSGVYASDMGLWIPDAAKALRYKKSLDRNDLLMFYNVFLLNRQEALKLFL